jgi:hypothetical protein
VRRLGVMVEKTPGCKELWAWLRRRVFQPITESCDRDRRVRHSSLLDRGVFCGRLKIQSFAIVNNSFICFRGYLATGPTTTDGALDRPGVKTGLPHKSGDKTERRGFRQCLSTVPTRLSLNDDRFQR